MGERTAGQEADDTAFEEMLEAWRVEYRSNRMAPRYLDTEHRMWMRFAWDAGRKHDGCCVGSVPGWNQPREEEAERGR